MPLRHLVLVLLLCCSASAFAARPAVLDAFTRDLQGLDGRFEQRVYSPDGELAEQSEGRVALSAPRQFRWEYAEPTPQLIIADGDHVWVYDPDLEQAQVRKQSHEEQQSPLAALIDPDELERQFVVIDAGSREGLAWVELQPRGEDPPFDRARLGFDGAVLARMELSDALGQRTDVRFGDWQRNPRFAADTFRFQPPAGVDIIGETIEPAEVYPLQE
jgi:outer membrane lipoprotein carrier protein